MKKLLLVLIAVTLAIFEAYQDQGLSFSAEGLLPAFTNESENTSLLRAFENRQSDLQVQGKGEVIKVLRDDTKGSQDIKNLLSRAGRGQVCLWLTI